ncbi:hypothetical protein [Flavobacterium daemonense]|uniref:hypothetical protein n=1 Tax=Flavobacterium daemonense TaxID=1393049 RepID=UPI001184F89C|nr:hypothetical protein [Flavobacterium daemonense]KAF2337224.1 hypothetical protein FND99_02085 [Flavobacterium daemonense]
MTTKNSRTAVSNTNNIHSFSANVMMSAYQPIDIKPSYGRKWLTNGTNNANYRVYKDAYDDSPTNASIINSFVNYIYGEGLEDINGQNINKYISEEDVLLICQDYKTYGGYAIQIIWSVAKKPLRIEYIPVYKLGVNLNDNYEIDGFWYSWDWCNQYRYKPAFYPLYDGVYKGADLEILLVRRPTPEPYFPIPDYLAGIPWANVEGRLANAAKHHFINALGVLTVINYNNGRIHEDDEAKAQAQKVRDDITGTENQSKVIVAFNDGIETAVTVDQLSPPELNQQNVFYSEEAERKLIVAHSAPPILFAGSTAGNGFSSNADEIATATRGLYRENINPMRKVIIRGLNQVFSVIDSTIELDFKDFDEETRLENTNNTSKANSTNLSLLPTDENSEEVDQFDEATKQAQAQLRGSVGGVDSILAIQASYVAGTTSYASAIAMLNLIFGFNRLQAVRLLGDPQPAENNANETPIS